MVKIISSMRGAMLSVALLLLGAASLQAAVPSISIREKATRFFDQKEWASATAMYGLLISESPSDADAYAHAIVAAGMLDDPSGQLDLTTRALNAALPLDSLFSRVERLSLSLAQTSLYRDFLLRVRHAHPWMARNIDSQLLRYYTFRRNPYGMIACSRQMLAGMPDHPDFLYPLAQGLLLDGRPEEAMKVYLKILAINPESLEALLYLGNYHADRARTSETDRQAAIDYLSRAAALRSTPYLSKRLAALRQ